VKAFGSLEVKGRKEKNLALTGSKFPKKGNPLITKNN